MTTAWFDERIANGAAAAGVQMDGFTAMIAANGFNRAAKAYIMYQIPKASANFYIKGANARDPE